MTTRLRGRQSVAALALALTAVVLPAAPAAADFVAPASLAATEGALSYGFGTSLTAQQIIGVSQLTGLNVGDQLVGVQFRLDGGLASPAVALSITDFTLSLGPSTNAVGSLSTNFSANQGAGTVTVFSGNVTFPANSFPGGATPNAFGPVITFSSSYTYTGGPLLITWTYSDSSVFQIDAQAGGVPDAQYQQANGFQTAVADATFAESAVPMRFVTATAVAAPEPGTLALLALGLCGGVSVVRRRRG